MGQIICVRTEDHWLCGPLNTKMSDFLHLNQPKFFVSACQHPPTPTPMPSGLLPIQHSQWIKPSHADGGGGCVEVTSWQGELTRSSWPWQERDRKKELQRVSPAALQGAHTLSHTLTAICRCRWKHACTPLAVAAQKIRCEDFVKTIIILFVLIHHAEGQKEGLWRKLG